MRHPHAPMSLLNRRRKGSKWGHISRWHPHQHPWGHAPWTAHSPRVHVKHSCVCVQFNLWGLTRILCFLCEVKKRGHKWADKRDQTLRLQLGCESLNRRWCSQPHQQSLSSLGCFHQSTQQMIPSPSLHFVLFLHKHAVVPRHNRGITKTKESSSA